MPKVIQEDVDLRSLYLEKLPDFLEDVIVKGDFYCPYNSLTSLKGAPKKVGGDFYCHNNSLTSLEGAPKEVGGSFLCPYNSLTSLEGAPKEVGGYFFCSYNSLTSLEGLPKEIGEDLYISFAKGIYFTEEEIRKVSNIKGRVYIIEA